MATEVPRTRGPPLRTWNGGDFYERVPRNSSTKLPPRPRIRLEKEEPLGTRVFSRAPISSSIKSLTRKSPESGDGKIGRSADRSDPFSRRVFSHASRPSRYWEDQTRVRREDRVALRRDPILLLQSLDELRLRGSRFIVVPYQSSSILFPGDGAWWCPCPPPAGPCDRVAPAGPAGDDGAPAVNACPSFAPRPCS